MRVEDDLPISMVGVTPGLQKRSKERMKAFVDAAIKMLQDRSFDKLSVNDLCASVGVTVGSFYKRFSSKETFIEFVQRSVAAETRRKWMNDLTSSEYTGAELRVFIERTVSGVILWSRKYEGLTRASLRYDDSENGIWNSTRSVGLEQAKLLTPIILKIIERDYGRDVATDPEVEKAIRFAFQAMHATVQMMILVNPGPLTIHDAATAPTLARLMSFAIEEAVRQSDEAASAVRL